MRPRDDIGVGRFTTSCDELIGIFRAALLSAIPHLDEALVHWREEKAYDGWDWISEGLYEAIVLSTFRTALEDGRSLSVPQYGFTADGDSDFVEVASRSFEVGLAPRMVFERFSTRSEPLDCIIGRPWGVLGEDSVDIYQEIPFEEAVFALRRRVGDGWSEPIPNF